MIEVQCITCGKAFRRHQSDLKKAKTGPFCSKTCVIPWNKGRPWTEEMKQKLSALASNGNRAKEKNGHWKGGRYIDKQGYVHIRVDGKDRKEHTAIIEAEIGRKLQKGEVVHHINENRQDNRRDNLELLTISEHMKRHHPPGSMILRPMGTITCIICHTPFQGTTYQKICSPACRRMRMRVHYKTYHKKHSKKLIPILINCHFCGVAMLRVFRKNTRFFKCKSPACTLAYNRLLRHEKGIANTAASS
jgi:endogenous inhibitor of DNA gyrase (YacG/DUF329 family)